MTKRSANWGPAIAKRIGMSGDLEYTMTKVGQTLHLPCARGHIVDFPITGGIPPEVVVKKLLQRGWTVGHKPVCPKHSRKRKPEREQGKAEEMPKAANDTPTPAPAKKFEPLSRHASRPKIIEALTQFDNLSINEIADLTMLKGDTVSHALRRLIAEGTVVRLGAGTINAPYKHTLAAKAQEPAKPPEEKPMSATVTPIAEAPKPSEPGLAARRAAIEWLVEAFDADKGRYRSGVSDASIAKETGLSEHAVAEIRELNFGPLKEPAEIENARGELNRLEQRIAEFEAQATATVEEWRTTLGQHRHRLGALIAKNGWQQP